MQYQITLIIDMGTGSDPDEAYRDLARAADAVGEAAQQYGKVEHVDPLPYDDEAWAIRRARQQARLAI